MTMGSLFAGIGGFELAATWAGIEPIWSNEIDPRCCRVLRKNFQHKIIEKDIKELTHHDIEPIDILTGGFPCQPVSTSGKRKGDKDYRWLWPENLRIIRMLRPPYYLGENVLGLLNWEGGILFDKVQTDLENEGYEITPIILPIASKNAWHKRDRIWFIAKDRNSFRWSGKEWKEKSNIRGQWEPSPRNGDGVHLSAHNSNRHSNGKGRYRDEINTTERKLNAFNRLASLSKVDSYFTSKGLEGVALEKKRRIFATQGDWQMHWLEIATRFCGMDDGVSDRVDRIAECGNSISPQVALEIFKAIKAVSHETQV